jgi:uncharacterized protein (TIGR01777 family)
VQASLAGSGAKVGMKRPRRPVRRMHLEFVHNVQMVPPMSSLPPDTRVDHAPSEPTSEPPHAPSGLVIPAAAARFVATSTLEATPQALWDWHARPGAFERLSPPWQRVELVSRASAPQDPGCPIAEGATLTMRVHQGPLALTWVARHLAAERGRSFTDLQERGPFAFWFHHHGFLPGPTEGTAILRDDVCWRLPAGRLGHALAGGKFRSDFERMFRYRHAITALDLARHRGGPAPMRIAISGASGLVGQALVPFLTTAGHRVDRLVRREARGPDEIRWDPAAGTVDLAALEGVDAVIHLAGENVGDGRWTEARKRAILESREQGTATIANAIAKLSRPPSVFVSASASGYYGSDATGDAARECAEDAPSGSDFLAEVCRRWEAAAEPARAAGVRVVHPRIGVVLDARGGALAKLLTPFRLGLGGRVGDGRQWMSWIAMEDLLGALLHLLATPTLSGPVNLGAPEPVQQATFAKTLGRAIGRPSFMPLPGFAVKAMFGEMGETIVLGGTRMVPKALLASGFRFAFPDLEGALRHTLGRT